MPTESIELVATRLVVLRLGVLLGCLLTCACGCWITDETARAWQEEMSEALVPGYQSFRPINCDDDIGWSLFSYDLPSGFDATNTISLLHRQIDGTAPMFAARPGGMASRWEIVKETSTELQLQYRINTYGFPGYDEWRVRVDASRRRVTAMYSNLDSEVERAAYPHLLAEFEKAHK